MTDKEIIFKRLSKKLKDGLAISIDSQALLNKEIQDRSDVITVLSEIDIFIRNRPEILAYCLALATTDTFILAFDMLSDAKKIAIMKYLAERGADTEKGGDDE